MNALKKGKICKFENKKVTQEIGCYTNETDALGAMFFENQVSKKTLSRLLCLSVRTIEKYMQEGLPFRKFGRAVRFRLSEVESWLQKWRRP